MVDINLLKVSDNFYSVKCSIDFLPNDVADVRIMNVDLVNPTGVTTYKKLRTIFTSNGTADRLNRDKYKGIYDALFKKLINKFKMKTIKI